MPVANMDTNKLIIPLGLSKVHGTGHSFPTNLFSNANLTVDIIELFNEDRARIKRNLKLDSLDAKLIDVSSCALFLLNKTGSEPDDYFISQGLTKLVTFATSIVLGVTCDMELQHSDVYGEDVTFALNREEIQRLFPRLNRKIPLYTVENRCLEVDGIKRLKLLINRLIEINFQSNYFLDSVIRHKDLPPKHKKKIVSSDEYKWCLIYNLFNSILENIQGMRSALCVTLLETILVSDSQSGEISYKFALRLAKHLKKDYDTFNVYKRLYKCRSEYYHSGKTNQFSGDDMRLLNQIVQEIVFDYFMNPDIFLSESLDKELLSGN